MFIAFAVVKGVENFGENGVWQDVVKERHAGADFDSINRAKYLICSTFAIVLQQRRNLYASEFVKISWHGIVVFYLASKDTTKNAHTQVKLAIIFKKDRFISISDTISTHWKLAYGWMLVSLPSVLFPPLLTFLLAPFPT